jgi:hypothetical protein
VVEVEEMVVPRNDGHDWTLTGTDTAQFIYSAYYNCCAVLSGLGIRSVTTLGAELDRIDI